MRIIKKLNRSYLNLIYKLGDKLKNPIWMILSIWIPLLSIILIINFELLSTNFLMQSLIILGIPVVYATVLLSYENIQNNRRYNELKQLGVKVFGDEIKFKSWMYSSAILLNNRKPIETDPDEVREVLIKIDHGIIS